MFGDPETQTLAAKLTVPPVAGSTPATGPRELLAFFSCTAFAAPLTPPSSSPGGILGLLLGGKISLLQPLMLGGGALIVFIMLSKRGSGGRSGRYANGDIGRLMAEMNAMAEGRGRGGGGEWGMGRDGWRWRRG